MKHLLPNSEGASRLKEPDQQLRLQGSLAGLCALQPPRDGLCTGLHLHQTPVSLVKVCSAGPQPALNVFG